MSLRGFAKLCCLCCGAGILPTCLGMLDVNCTNGATPTSNSVIPNKGEIIFVLLSCVGLLQIEPPYAISAKQTVLRQRPVVSQRKWQL